MNVFKTDRSIGTAVLVSQILLLSLVLTPEAVQAADDSIRLGGQVVFTAQAGADGMNADDRAKTIQRNLDNALVAAQDRTSNSVNIVYVKGIPVITLGGYQVVTVSSDDAKQAGTTPAILAQRWADALRNSLKDQSSVNNYVAQLTGASPAGAGATFPPATAQANGSASATGGSNLPPSVPPPPYAPGQGNNTPYGNPNAMPGQASYDQYNRTTGSANMPPYQGGAYGGGGYGGGPYGGAPYGGGGGYGGYPMQGRVVYAAAGSVIPVSLRTSISTQAASPGDLIEAAVDGGAGGAQIPPGSVLVGQIVAAKAGGFLGRSGMLEVKFNRLRTPDGMEVPVSAHIKGGIGKYTVGGDDTIHGETWKNKVGQGLLRGAIGAGAGAALGTAVGAIAGGGHGVGRGAWSGTAIGGGLGVADSLLLRKGRDVTIKAGTNMQVELESPISMGGGQPGMMGMPPGGMPPYPQY